MTNFKSSITILACHEKDKTATKKFIMSDNGTVKKVSFLAGTLFTHEEAPVSNLLELSEVIEGISTQPNKFVIRGQIKANMPKVVQRKKREPHAAFDSVARPYIMLDIDRQSCPDYFDPVENPKEIVTWVQNMLPEPFQNVSCYYKFSSSQNVYPKTEDGKNTVSIHLFYWCDKAVLDEEWKRYFCSVPVPVDPALFDAVQMHYIANPIFERMEDPLPVRSGIFVGKHDVVAVPAIPQAENKKVAKRPEQEPIVREEDKNKALELLLSHYKEGFRNRLCGAIAATLYRGGWSAENAADFVYHLAEKGSDSEAYERYNNGIRICYAVDHNMPAQGIPVLKDELGITDLDHILDLLGVGKPDIDSVISKLSNLSTIPNIKEALKLLLFFPDAQRKFYLDRMSKQTSFKKGSLQSLLQEVASEESGVGPQDLADSLMETLLMIEYQGGQHLLYTSDNSYFHYTGSHWQKIPEQQIKKSLLPHARELIAEVESGSVTNFNNAVLNILEGRAYRQDDPLRQIDQDPPAVINCQNGELWFNEDGDVSLRPHRPESYLRHCLNVEYDPSAKAPMFKEAALEIFSNSSDPEDMFRHFMELAGYICQPWRKLAIIVLLHGGGSNGKTSLVKIIRRMLGENTVMSDRISDIEGNVFKIGDLDGKLMLLDDDVDGGTCLPDGFLKKISEEKAMTGQHKHKPPFEFICRAVPVMLANDYPVTSDLTRGLRRRLMAFPFNRTFELHEMQPGLFDAIWEAEASGILNHAVAGFTRLKKRGGFEEPEDCKKAKKEWIIRSNVLTTFIDEMCETGENCNVYLGDFYKAFNSYCHETGVKNIQSLKGVRSRLEGLGYRIGMLNGKRAVWGIRLTTPDLRAKLEPKL